MAAETHGGDAAADEEAAHFQRIIAAMAAYTHCNRPRVDKARRDYNHFGPALARMLPHYEEKLKRVEECISINQEFFDELIVPHRIFENTDSAFPMPQTFDFSLVSEHDAEKVRSTLRQVVRDWSLEGQPERDCCYKPLIDELIKRCPPKRPRRRRLSDDFQDLAAEEEMETMEILVPGAGLGRLVHDIAKLGYSCQGNEFSYYMLLTSEFILNRIAEMPNGCDICPFALQFSNVWAVEHQLRRVRIPDVLPGDLPNGGRMSMVAGDFLEVYKDQPGEYNCIITCFFLDTAKNVVDYIKLIHYILAPGGCWINLGPLLYHYEEVANEPSIELAYDELRQIITSVGFNIGDEQRVSTNYASNIMSMYSPVYDCIRFTAFKQWI